jgi:hypothetical protein
LEKCEGRGEEKEEEDKKLQRGERKDHGVKGARYYKHGGTKEEQ